MVCLRYEKLKPFLSILWALRYIYIGSLDLFPSWTILFRLDTGVAGRAKPFGVEIRNVKCLRCGNYGHQSGDRECPLKDAIMPNEESRLKRDDPLTAILAQTDASEVSHWISNVAFSCILYQNLMQLTVCWLESTSARTRYITAFFIIQYMLYFHARW